jgi:hypothetical protein
VPWDRHNPLAIGHDAMFALGGHIESGLFQCPDGAAVMNAVYLWHMLRRNLDFP